MPNKRYSRIKKMGGGMMRKGYLAGGQSKIDANKDGNVSDAELKDYLSDTMTYFARRYYGRDQKVQIHNGG